MDPFDRNAFYGCTIRSDEKLRTTTRNYEFKYNSPDHLERVIERVQMNREQNKQREMLTRSCQLRNAVKVLSPFSKPLAVETQIGQSTSKDVVIKVMTDEEIDNMISQALQPPNEPPVLSSKKNHKEPLFEDSESIDNTILLATQKTNKDLQVETKNAASSMEILPDLQPQWVEIGPIEKGFSSKKVSHDTSESENIFDVNLAMDLKVDELHLDEELNEGEIFDTISFDDFVEKSEESDSKIDGEAPPDSLLSLGIESPLNANEHAEMERVLGRVLPHIPEMDFQNLDSDEECESSVHDEMELFENDREQTKFQVQPIIKIRQLKVNSEPIKNPDASHRCVPSETLPSLRTPLVHHEPIKKTAVSLVRHTFRTPLVPVKTSKERPPTTSYTSQHVITSTDRQHKTSQDNKIKKQVDVLKQEKIRIFSKVTSTQERVIEIIDKLRLNLLQQSLPDGHVELKLRERNAIEFFIRFSRNYLFPLGNMIKKLRVSQQEDYSCATTNEPCIKVCGIYGLLCQALDCYHKQLRHFYTDSFPKKLDTLVNMIMDTTEICLEKKIFDKQDALIECLQLHCSSFLGFIIKFSEQKQSARVEAISVRSERKKNLRSAKPSSKWDSTMNLEKLNMYEPKVVAKKSKKKQPIKTTQPCSSRETLGLQKRREQSSVILKDNDPPVKTIPDPVDTQVRNPCNAESVQHLNAALEEPDGEFSRTLKEALQDITKDDFHQLMKPFVSNLSKILKSSDNPQTVESVLDVLNLRLLAKCKQGISDAAATENITQNGNTYQKEVTKKGADSSKGEQRRRRNENRQRRAISKTNFNNNSVKEGSTEQTERYSSRNGRTGTVCDKQSLSYSDDSVNISTKQKTRKSVGGVGAFLSAANKPTPASTTAATTNRIGIPPPQLAVSPVQLDEVIVCSPPPQIQQRVATKWMTSREADTMPVKAFAPEFDQKGVGDGGHLKEYRKEISSHWEVSDDNDDANAFDGAQAKQGARRKNRTESPSTSSSSAKNGAKTKSGQIGKLHYANNMLYTFVKYSEDGKLSPEILNVVDNVDNTTKLSAKSSKGFSVNSSENESFKSARMSDEKMKSVSANLNHDAEKLTHEAHMKLILEERQNFIEQCKTDSLYNNPEFPEPWKVLSKISNQIACEIVKNLENELSLGEESYVRDFINMELQT